VGEIVESPLVHVGTCNPSRNKKFHGEIYKDKSTIYIECFLNKGQLETIVLDCEHFKWAQQLDCMNLYFGVDSI